MLQNIRINVAYDDVLVFTKSKKIKYVYPNILTNYNAYPDWQFDFSKLDEIKNQLGIEFPYTMDNEHYLNLNYDFSACSSHMFEIIFDNSFRTFIPDTFDNLYNSGNKFIYPISIHTLQLFYATPTIDLNPKLVERVNQNLAKIVFFQPFEGDFGQKNEELYWMYNLCKKYNFNKNNVIVICANLLIKERCDFVFQNNELNFTPYPYSYFCHHNWFYPNGSSMLSSKTKNSMKLEFKKYLEYKKTKPIEKHFLSFNRITRSNRVALFAELCTNPKLINKSIHSMAASTIKPFIGNSFLLTIASQLDNSYKHSKNRLLNFYKNYDISVNVMYDTPNLDQNLASLLCGEAHSKTFVNIVTESQEKPTCVFFSEKTFKPIFCCQPFIIWGTPNSLKKLKEYGFKTFDKWWDESYDDELDFTKRFEKIIDIMEEISEWSLEKCFQITQEMEETLIHNFNNMINDKDVVNLYNTLNTYESSTLNVYEGIIKTKKLI